MYKNGFGEFPKKAIWWYLVSFAGLLAEWILFKSQLEIEYSSVIGTAIKAAGDVAVVMIPYWLLSPRWRWIAVAPVWIYAIWCVANLAYFRFWGDLIPAAAITMGGNVNGDLMQYGMSLLRWSDVLYFLIPAFTTAICVFIKPSSTLPFSRKWKITGVSMSLILTIAGQYSYFKTAYSWDNGVAYRSPDIGLKDHFLGGYTGQRRLYVYNGLAYYGVRYIVDAVDILTNSINLTDARRSEIDDFLSLYKHNKPLSTEKLPLDSLNVVYIIVESLNSEMIGKKVGGFEVMPVLDSLSRSEGTVYFDNVVSQIKASSSSDGHLLLMTGLLPPEKIAYSITYGDKNMFPSLANVMPKHDKILMLADDGVCWNEGNTLKNFGLGNPLTTKDREGYDIETLGRDGAMFRHAADMVKKARQPFFMTLMTISMHIPFKEIAWRMPETLANNVELSQMEKDYANVCHYTDRYIGEFLNALPSNTIIVIASDHSQGVTSPDDSSPAAAFMVVNAGRTERISRIVGQINLFPATLDIFGSNSDYGGLAPSAFNPCVDGTRDSYGNIFGNPSSSTLDTISRAYHVSDLIIRGDYFRK